LQLTSVLMYFYLFIYKPPDDGPHDQNMYWLNENKIDLTTDILLTSIDFIKI
jgi:hypothetical protein